jgi:SAM-dependent methyltransferase
MSRADDKLASTPSAAIPPFVDAAFWIVLGRAPTALECRDVRDTTPDERRVLLDRLLSSPEFQSIRSGWSVSAGLNPDLEGALRRLGDDASFVRHSYECVLGRPADDEGFAHYASGLGRGRARSDVVRALVCSEEFDRRFQAMAPQHGVVPRDVQLCELANPAKWDNEEWLDILRSLRLSDDKLSMHRKPYEFTQLIYGCRRLGALHQDSTILSVGAGHELVLYWLANHARRVVATDMYEGVWQDAQGREGNPDVTTHPEDYAPLPYQRDRLTFLKMDGRRLAFRDGAFDIAYSLSSIEHFGGVDEASRTIREMARVLKPGGLLAVATEYVLHGPPHEETFQPEEFAALIDQPGLRPVQPIDDRVFDRYEYAAIDLYKNPYQAPHMVVRFNDTVFTTVMAFLRREG